jgi:hypothetical protein
MRANGASESYNRESGSSGEDGGAGRALAKAAAASPGSSEEGTREAVYFAAMCVELDVLDASLHKPGDSHNASLSILAVRTTCPISGKSRAGTSEGDRPARHRSICAVCTQSSWPHTKLRGSLRAANRAGMSGATP